MSNTLYLGMSGKQFCHVSVWSIQAAVWKTSVAFAPDWGPAKMITAFIIYLSSVKWSVSQWQAGVPAKIEHIQGLHQKCIHVQDYTHYFNVLCIGHVLTE